MMPKSMPGSAIFQHHGEPCYRKPGCLTNGRSVPDRSDDMHLDCGSRGLGSTQEAFDGVSCLCIAPP